MLLALDVGNTNLKIGVYDRRRLLAAWRLLSRRDQTADEYGLFIESLLRTRGLEAQAITGVAIANVEAPVQYTFELLADPY